MGDWQDRLVEAMEARGLSGGELGRRAGFTSQYINSLRSKDRGARLPLDTARRLAHALAVSVEWLSHGTGPRERLSDVYPVVQGGDPSDRYPSRAEAVALLETTVDPEVIVALRASLPDPPDTDPGRDFWIARAKELARDLRRIKADPELSTGGPKAAPSNTDTAPHKAPASGWRPSPLAAPPRKHASSEPKKK
jgi:transcriptional regulator with XRE-family HTH domain